MPRIIAVPDRGRPFSTMCLTLRRGSLDDPPDRPGIGWFTAQMLLRGSVGMTRQQVADALEGLGSIVDISVGRDDSMLWADAITRKREVLLGHLERIMSQPTFPAGELDKLKRETIADIHALRDDDASLGLRFFVRALYGDHAYGRPLKGSEAAIAQIERDDLVACYQSWSRAGAIVGLAGDVDEELGQSLFDRLTGALAEGSAERGSLPPIPRREAPAGWRVVIVDKPDRRQTQVFAGHVALQPEAGSEAPHAAGVHHPSWTPLLVGQTTFGGTFTSRFSNEIREKRGWSYGAWSQLSGDRRLATFMLRFYPAAKDLLPSLQLTDEMLQHFVADGPTDAELDAAQRYLQNGFVFTIDTAQRRLAELLSARLVGHSEDWVDGTVERLRLTRHADAVAAVRTHLRPSELVLTIVGTAKELEPQLKAWPRIGSLEVVDWRTAL